MESIIFSESRFEVLTDKDIIGRKLEDLVDGAKIIFPFWGKYRIAIPPLKAVDTYNGKHDNGTERKYSMTKNQLDSNAAEIISIEFKGEPTHTEVNFSQLIPGKCLRLSNGIYYTDGTEESHEELMSNGTLDTFGVGTYNSNDFSVVPRVQLDPDDLDRGFSAIHNYLADNSIYLKENNIFTVSKALSEPTDKVLTMAEEAGVKDIIVYLSGLTKGSYYIWAYKTSTVTVDNIAVTDIKANLVNEILDNAEFYMCFDEKELIDVDLVYTEAVDSSFNERDGAILEFEVKRKEITDKNQTIVFVKAIPFTEKTDNIYKK